MGENILGRVDGIWRHPVKSMLGERIDATLVTQRGVLGDRGYALLDPTTGKIASAKDPRRWPDMFRFRAEFVHEPMEHDSLPPVLVTLPNGQRVRSDDRDVETKICAAMGKSVQLLQTPLRQASAEGYWPDHEWIAERDTSFEYQFPEGTFFDGSMMHVITTATLQRLGQLYPDSQFAPERFRANLLIETTDATAAYIENSWIGQSVAIGDVVLRIERSCPRCVMTTLPQADLPKDPNILRSAVRENGGNVGVYAFVEKVGRLRKGDRVRVVGDA